MRSSQRIELRTLRLTLLIAFGLAGSAVAGDAIDFTRQIQPLLSDRCYKCHGPDARKVKSGLRLDQRESATQTLKSGATAIVAGKPGQSELVARIFSTDPDEVMPPPDSLRTLSDPEKELLRDWIADGAKWGTHWAFSGPSRPAVPGIEDWRSRIADLGGSNAVRAEELRAQEAMWSHWPRNAIDNFVLAKLLGEGLTPSPEASPETLCRRLFLDLTGLPPTIKELDEFLQSAMRDSQSAVEELVDRLLASPHYGERMAMTWLDSARYADSNGFQSDGSRTMWPWRDWVIEAFNKNMPFDRFTIEQLAGDLLPNPTPSQIVATGFNRNHRLNGEAGLIAEEWRVETVIDRVETTGTTWLALTLNCCRCHDHKFDPITQKEFYQLFSFFNNVAETGTLGRDGKNGVNTDPVALVPSASQAAELAKLKAAVEAAEKRVAEAGREIPRLVAEWEPGFRAKMEDAAAWTMLEPREVKSAGKATLTRQADGSWLASGTNPPKDTYTITAPVKEGQFTGLLIEAFPDPSLPNQSLGRYANGNFVLTGVEVEIAGHGEGQPMRAHFTKAEADYSQKGYEVRGILDAKTSKGWAVDGPTKRDPRRAMFLVDSPLAVPAGASLVVRLRHEGIGGHNIGRFRLSVTSLPAGMVKLDGGQLSTLVATILATAPGKRTPQQRAELEKFFRANFDSPVKKADGALAAAKKALETFQAKVPSTMVMKELPQPRDSFFLHRGEYDKPGDKVTAALPAALPPMPEGAPMNRLGLARWIASPSNPLTARVWVNRAWEGFFGVGLVKTTENFGVQADWPSHPDLLDWLATEFVRLGWDMKAMQKLMAMSATYRQSSHVAPALVEKDPDNRLLARGPRFRLQGELLRDQALAVSGLLVAKIGGPSVRPYMPAGVWDETSRYGDLRNYQPDTGEGLYRRTLYTIWKRTAAPPAMLIFDSPTREICTVKRSRTNTPLQALALLNEVTYVEAARVLAQRMIAEGGTTPEERIAWGFRRITCRKPDADEVKLLAGGLRKRLARFQNDPEGTGRLVGVGASKPDTAVNAAELAAYTMTANVLLNLDETVTRE